MNELWLVASEDADGPHGGDAIRTAVARTVAWHEASAAAPAIAAALAVARSADQQEVDRFASASHIVIAGAGSSLYIAQVAAAAMRESWHLPAQAVPLSEVLLRPAAVFTEGRAGSQPVVVVSRSGATTEALDVVRAARAGGHHTLAITCRPESELVALSDSALTVPEADEAAIVMTRSFAALAMLLIRLAARLGEAAPAADLDGLPEHWAEAAKHVDRAFDLASARHSRIVVLGGGAAFGLANEAVLKLTETSQVPASAFHPLEFRHGPISVCEPGVLVVGILLGSAASAERRVLDESAALGATTWALGPDGPGQRLGELARLPLVLLALQALALGVAVARGSDPDAPRHLGRVVVIDRGE